MNIKLQGRQINFEETKKRWLKWYKQHKAGKPIAEIADENINPLTHKKYTPGAIYYGFKRLEKL